MAEQPAAEPPPAWATDVAARVAVMSACRDELVRLGTANAAAAARIAELERELARARAASTAAADVESDATFVASLFKARPTFSDLDVQQLRLRVLCEPHDALRDHALSPFAKANGDKLSELRRQIARNAIGLAAMNTHVQQTGKKIYKALGARPAQASEERSRSSFSIEVDPTIYELLLAPFYELMNFARSSTRGKDTFKSTEQEDLKRTWNRRTSSSYDDVLFRAFSSSLSTTKAVDAVIAKRALSATGSLATALSSVAESAVHVRKCTAQELMTKGMYNPLEVDERDPSVLKEAWVVCNDRCPFEMTSSTNPNGLIVMQFKFFVQRRARDSGDEGFNVAHPSILPKPKRQKGDDSPTEASKEN